MALESKKRSHAESTSAGKKPRHSSDGNGNATAGPSKAPRPAPAFTSSLKADEGDFPRGGGTTLSAFELKQVREEGRREAEAELSAEAGSRPAKKPKRGVSDREARRIKKNEVRPEKEFDKDQIRAEHLTYKRLTTGTRVLARVHSILPLHLVLSLPNNLLAHVPITEISSTLTALLSAEQDAMSVSEDDEEEKEDEDAEPKSAAAPELVQLFKPGQYYPAVVVTTYPTANQAFISQYPSSETIRLAARVEMSLVPEKVNSEVAKAEMEKGYVLVGEVKEEEDKGWRVGLGLGDEAGGNTVGGWIGKEQVTKNSPNATLVPGQLVRASISSVTAGGRVLQLSLNNQTAVKGQLNEVSNVASILPGHLVTTLITAVMPSGLNVKIGGFFDGTIDLTHLELGDQEIEERYKVGKKIRARVLYDNQSVTPRRFGLSAMPHILDLTSPLATDKVTPLEQAVPIGKVINAVTVKKVQSEWGLICRTDDGLEAFVHISHISDDRLPSLSSALGPYAHGTVHRARVIGHSPLDGVILLSLESKVIDQVFMSVSELSIGQLLKGTIRRLTDKMLFVDISGSVDGIVHPLHYADIRLKHPERRFKVGGTVKARVLDLEVSRSRVVLTLKKTLVESTLPVIKTYAEYKQGVVVAGTVMKLLDKGLVVELFGGMKAFVPQSEASQNFTSNLAEIFYVGQSTQLRITELQPEAQRLVGSIRQALPSALAAAALKIADEVSGQVAQIHAEQAVITLQPSQVTALLSLSSLSNHRHMTIDEIRSSLKIGEKMDGLVIVSQNTQSGLYIVSYPRTPSSHPLPSASGTESKSTGLTWRAVRVGQTVKGKVVAHSTLAASLQVDGLRGRLYATNISDDYDTVSFPQPEGPLPIGQEVECIVLKVVPQSKLLELSSRPSKVASTSAPIKDREINSVADLQVGKVVRGFVKNISAGGVFVALGTGVTARVMIKELFDDYVKEWQPRFKIGQLVSGKILKIDAKTDFIEMTFKTKAAAVGKTKKVAQLGLSDFTEGQNVVAVVKKVEEYGIFLRIEGSNVSGLCHKSELADNKKADIASALKGFREGDQVKAKILGVDNEKGRVSFGLKASYFGEGQPGEDEDEDEVEDEDEEMDGDEDEEEDGDDEEEEDGEGDEDVVLGEDDDEEDMEDAEQGEREGSDDDVEEEDGAAEAESDDEDHIALQVDQPAASTSVPKKTKTPAPAAALDVSGGFDWSGAAPTADDASSDEDEDDSEDQTTAAAPSSSTAATVSKSKSKSKTLDLTATAPDARPESTVDFERALLASPNSSFLWIQYMSFLLQLHEVDKARRIGRSALEKIGYREEEEKLNVWMALVNLELGFGTVESTEKVFKEASQYNDARTVWGRYAEALQVAGKDEMAEEAFKKIVKKFSAYPESWLSAATFYLKKGDVDAARDLLPRSLKSLDKPKHREMIEKMAILEFKHGEAERGKTLFEGLLERSGKKLDLWSVYIDQIARTGDIQAVRSLFDRALDRKLTAKKAKFLFKKWLALEGRIGNAAGQEKAKERAKDWVAANVKSEGVEDEGEEEDDE